MRRSGQRGIEVKRRQRTAGALERAGLWPVAIMALGLAAYAGGLHGSWVFDDFPAIKENPHIRHLSGIGQAAWGLPQTPLSRRPAVAASVALNYAWGRYDVFGYHLVNLALHLASALLIYGLVRRSCAGPVLVERIGRRGRLLAAIVALVWVVHPLNSEAVMYVTQRTTLMESTFTLATLYAAVRAWQAARPRAWLVLSVACCALAMASKESAAVVPLLVVLLDRAFFTSSWREAWKLRRGFYLSLLACEAVLALLFAIGPDCEAVGLDTGITPWQYLLTEAGVLLHYLRLTLWPRPLVLAYDWQPVSVWTDAMPAGSLVLLLLATSVWLLVRRPAYGFFGAWFFVLLAPTSSVIPIATELLAERRMYIASLAVIVPAAGCAWLLLERVARGRARPTGWRLAVPLALLLMLLVGQTRARVGDFADELTLWSKTVAQCPGNPVSQNNLGVALAEHGRFREAVEHYGRALELHPNPVESDAHNNLGAARFNLGDLTAAKHEFLLALQIEPDSAKAHSNLALTLATIGDVAEAEHHSRRSLELDGQQVNGRLNHGFVLCRLGKFAESAAQYRAAVLLEPENSLAHYNLGLALAQTGELDQGLVELQIASRLGPGDVRIHNKLAQMLLDCGRIREARSHLQAILKIEPQNQRARAALRKIEMPLADE